MKQASKIFTLIAALLGLAGVATVDAQSRYTLSSGAELKVSGTSTLHDWEMVSKNATGQASLTAENGQLKSISSLSVSLKAETLASGKSQMDKNAYKALKSDKNPTIQYTLNEFKHVQGDSWTAVGQLTIAGVAQTMTIPVTVSRQGDAFVFTGSTSSKLTDFKVDPPTAMLGTIKTGNEVVLSFTAKFTPVL